MKKLSIVVGITGIEPIKACEIQEPPLFLSLFPITLSTFTSKKDSSNIYSTTCHCTERGNRTHKRPTLLRFHYATFLGISLL